MALEQLRKAPGTTLTTDHIHGGATVPEHNRPQHEGARRLGGVQHGAKRDRPPQAPVLSAIPVEFQLVAVLDHGGTTGRAGVQYQHTHDFPEYVVASLWWNRRPAGHDVLLLLRARRARGAPGFVRWALAGDQRRRPQGDRPLSLVQLVSRRRRAVAHLPRLSGA